MRLERKALFVFVAAVTLLGLTVVPGLAAPEKQFTITAPTSLTPGTQDISVVVRNTTPNGNSNISSVILRTSGSSGWTINSLVGPGTGVRSDGNTTISINSFAPIKPARATTFTLNVTVPDLGCTGGTITWSAEAFTGNSFGGDTFNFKTISSTNVTTAVASTCSSITVTKHADPNFNGTVDDGEAALQGWEFQLDDESPVLTNADGEITWIVAAGTYSVCETDDRANPDAEGYGTSIEAWVNTSPGGDRCEDVTVGAGDSVTLEFTNALGTLDCDPAPGSSETQEGGGTTAQLTRGPNADGSEPCILIPYELTADTTIVRFIKDLTTQPYATFELVITWGVPALDYPNFGETTFDLDGDFESGGDQFVPDNCVVEGGVAKVPAIGAEQPWCHAGTVVVPAGDGYSVTETFLGTGDPSIVRNR